MCYFTILKPCREGHSGAGRREPLGIEPFHLCSIANIAAYASAERSEILRHGSRASRCCNIELETLD